MLKTAAFAICAVVCLPIPALATPWTFTQAGTIRAGQDYGGLFFAPDTALGGKSFSITYLLDPALYPDQIESDPFINYRYGANSGSMTITTTIDNVSRAYVLDPSKYSFGASQLYNYITAGSAGADLAGQLHTGYTSGGDYVSANTVVYSNTNNYHLGLNLIRPGTTRCRQVILWKVALRCGLKAETRNFSALLRA